MHWSPTIFSRSGPVGIPPVPWTEKKTIERKVGRAKDLSAPRYFATEAWNNSDVWTTETPPPPSPQKYYTRKLNTNYCLTQKWWSIQSSDRSWVKWLMSGSIFSCLRPIAHLLQQWHNSNFSDFSGETFKSVWSAVIFCECNDDTTAVQRRVLQTALWHYTS
jgi:hypothetical protein